MYIFFNLRNSVVHLHSYTCANTLLNHSRRRSQYYTGLKHALLSFVGSMTVVSVRAYLDEQMACLG